MQPNEISYQKNSVDIISGWNEKLKMKNDELSKFVPFVELFCIFNNDNPLNVSDERLAKEGIDVTIMPITGTEEKAKILPIFSLMNQQTSTDPSGRLLYSRGIPGIESLVVTAENFDSNAARAHMVVSIPTLEKDIKINNALRKLLILNSDWLLMYGWARESEGVPLLSGSDNANVKIDLTSAHKGYYKVCRLIMSRYDWELSKDKMATGNFEFATESRTIVTSFDISHYRGNIQNYLSDRIALKESSTTKQLTDVKKIHYKIDKIKSKVGKNKSVIDSTTPLYYSLGWVLEAMRQSLPEKVKNRFKHIEFDKFAKPKTMKVFLGEKNSSPLNIQINNLGCIPLSASEVKTRVFDNMNDHFMWAIMELCKIASESSVGIFDVVAVMGYDGQSVFILDLNSTLSRSKAALSVHISAENSLLEEASFASQIPKDASYNMTRMVNTENGRAVIFSVFFKDAQLVQPKTEIGKLIKSLGIVDSNANALDTKELKEKWQKIFTQAEEKNTDKIYKEIIENQAVDVGLALRAYFTTLTLTIHGTALVPYATHVDFRGFVAGVDGLYWVYTAQDALTPGEFKTILTCTLQEPY